MKTKKAFTIVEILVIIAVISVLSALSILINKKVQAEARDAKRKADVLLLASAFEKYYDKNGEYPGGCSKSIKSHNNCRMSIMDNSNLNNPTKLYSDSSLKDLQDVFPEIPNNFGEPSLPKGKVFGGQNNGSFYFFIGQLDVNINLLPNKMLSASLFGTQGGSDPINSSGIQCSNVPNEYIWFSVADEGRYPRPAPTAIMLGYKSEVDKKWYFYIGKRNMQVFTYGVSPAPESGFANVSGRTIGQCAFTL